MNLEHLELLIDLVEIRLDSFLVIDKDDLLELENLRFCRRELYQLHKKEERRARRLEKLKEKTKPAKRASPCQGSLTFSKE